MTFPRKIGLLMLLVAILATAGHECGLALPSLRWFYSFEPSVGNGAVEQAEGVGFFARVVQGFEAHQARWIGHLLCGLLALVGLLLLIFGGGFRWNPLTLRKLARFRSSTRGYRSFLILTALVALALLDQVLIGKLALAVRYEGKWYFPAFVIQRYDAADFGGKGEADADYRSLQAQFIKNGGANRVWMPLVPFDSTFDTDDLQRRVLPFNEGILNDRGGREPFSGIAYVLDPNDPEIKLRMSTFRQGKLSGRTEVYDGHGETLAVEQWLDGKRLSRNSPQGGAVADEPTAETPTWVELLYPPAPPSVASRHYLGTDSRGWDVAAQLYGGFQIVLKAAVIYTVLTYLFGIVIGCSMGYFGGKFDLLGQRLVEILSNVPFLYVVMIISSNLGQDKINVGKILLVICAFSWIEVSMYLRSQTFKEKAREYVAAARVMGAGTGRIVFRHILPNSISTIVTLLPFSVVSIATSLTALDFLGFGLPAKYPSWGSLLSDGTANLEAVWIVSGVFTMMVLTLLLITFVGEAVREAFDPKKFTYYR